MCEEQNFRNNKLKAVIVGPAHLGRGVPHDFTCVAPDIACCALAPLLLAGTHRKQQEKACTTGGASNGYLATSQ